MKILFADERYSELADKESAMLIAIKEALMSERTLSEASSPASADVILIQEEKSDKDFRYIDRLVRDPVVGRFMEKVYTLNDDDCGTGLLRGLYTSLPRQRFDSTIHAIVPFMNYPNELIASKKNLRKKPVFLAGWRGSTIPNKLRSTMITALGRGPEFCCETTDSLINYSPGENETSLDLILNCKFSLCPAGRGPVTIRIYESMALSRCPVIIADDFVPPGGPDWNGFAIFYPEKEVAGLADFLRRNEHIYDGLGRKAYQVWSHYFAPSVLPNYYAQVLLKLVRNAPATDADIEKKRWQSTDFYGNKKWTLSQCVMNKMSGWSRMLMFCIWNMADLMANEGWCL
jgi:hypothetical protein